MFGMSLSDLTSSVPSLLGGMDSVDMMSGRELLRMLGSIGVDPEMLEGLGYDQILELLAARGIDLSDIAPEQITAMMDAAGSSANLVDIASAFIGSGKPGNG